MSKAFKVDDDLTIDFDVVKAKDLMAGDVIFHVEYAALWGKSPFQAKPASIYRDRYYRSRMWNCWVFGV